MSRMQRGRTSLTSSIVAMARAVYDVAPREYSATRDPLAIDLIPRAMRPWAEGFARAWQVPAVGHYALRAVTGTLFEQVALRTVAIDDVIKNGVRDGATQLVILGAGLDARPYRMPELAKVRVFEVDHPSTQTYKQRKIAGRMQPVGEHQFVGVDFAHDQMLGKLHDAGFDAEQRTVWVMEGVTMYLPRVALEATVTDVVSSAASGTRFALTYMPELRGALWSSPPVQRVVKQMFGLIGEPLIGRITTNDMRALLEGHGFTVLSDEAPPEWAARYTPSVSRMGMMVHERLAVAQLG